MNYDLESLAAMTPEERAEAAERWAEDLAAALLDDSLTKEE